MLRLALEPRRNRQILLAQELRIEQLRLISRAVIGKDGHDGVAGAELLGQANGAGDIDAGRAAEAEAFVLEQIEDDRQRLLVGNLIGGVDRRVFEILGDAALADALGDRGAFAISARRSCSSCRAPRPSDRRARCARRLLRALSAMATPASVPPVPTAQTNPSTLPSVCRQISGPVVSMWPRRLATLSNWLAQIAPFVSVLRQLRRQPAGEFHVIVGIGVGDGRHFDQFRAAQPQRVLFLLALGLRNDDDGAKAQGVADQREPDAGVAGGALDDDAAGPERALFHRVLDDEQGGAILDRLAGIHEFGLAENGAAGGRRNALEFDQRRIADRLDNSVAQIAWSANSRAGETR